MSALRQTVIFLTHPDVVVDPLVPVPDWALSPRGRARMNCAAGLPWMTGVRALWCSTERKARESAAILGGRSGLTVSTLAALGENDRSATGYLPRAAFEVVADQFFACPDQRVRGWERAVDAQRRIVDAVEVVLAGSVACGGDVVIVSHGGVGTLLLCHLRGVPIIRVQDQPANNGGNYFAFDAATRWLHHGWVSVEG